MKIKIGYKEILEKVQETGTVSGNNFFDIAKVLYPKSRERTHRKISVKIHHLCKTLHKLEAGAFVKKPAKFLKEFSCKKNVNFYDKKLTKITIWKK